MDLASGDGCGVDALVPEDEIDVLLVTPEETAMVVRAELGRDDLGVVLSWRHAGTLAGARKECRSAMPDVVVVDPNVQGCIGMEAVEAFAGLAPVVAVMEGGELEPALQAIRAGADDVLDLDLDDVWGALRRVRFAIARHGPLRHRGQLAEALAR